MSIEETIKLDGIEKNIDKLEEMDALAKDYRAKASESLDVNLPNEAIVQANNAIHLYKLLGNDEGIAEIMNFLGIVYASQAQDVTAVDCFLNGLDISLKYNYSHLIVRFYNNLGTKFIELHEYDKALDFLYKAEEELVKPACKKKDKYSFICLLTYLNLCIACTGNDEYQKAERYLGKAKNYSKFDDTNIYSFSLLFAECRLKWKQGDEDFINDNADRLIDGIMLEIEVSDYVTEIKDLCAILKDMKLIGHWRKVIQSFETFVNKNGTAYFKLMCIEFWLEFYAYIGDEKSYKENCVKYTELSFIRLSEISDEKSEAINLKIELQKKEFERQKAEAMSNTDRLTGLGNRYMLEKDAGVSAEKCKKDDISLVVGIIDIDCFKEVNDTYGHIRGDDYLSKISRILSVIIQKAGKVYRYGGDEFIVLMENVDENKVEKFAKAVKMAISDSHLENKNSVIIPEVTLSQGYKIIKKLDDSYTLESLIKEADKALYYVKENGRNGYAIETDSGMIK